MKKLLLIFMLFAVGLVASAQIVQQPFVNENIGTITTLSKVVPFESNLTGSASTGNWLVAQIDYKTMTGDSARVKFYVSANNDFTGITTVLNASSLVKAAATNTSWKTGQGYSTAVTKYEMINISNYPTGFVKVLIDTTTGVTTGYVTVTIKPYVAGYFPTWKESLMRNPVYNFSIATKTGDFLTKGTGIKIPFYPDRCVRSIAIQVNYRTMTAHAFNIGVYASGTQTFNDTTRLNDGTALKWTTGANITKWDTVYLGTIPTQYLMFWGDSCTGGNTSGKVDIFVKPIFK
jgi:hypothetical protein